MVRFVNLADRFDSTASVTQRINVTQFAEDLFADVNSGKKAQNILIEEVNLSGNMLRSTIDANYQWKGVEDGNSL